MFGNLICTFWAEQEDDKVAYFSAGLFINDKTVLDDKKEGEIEWAEDKILQKINEVKKDQTVEEISINYLNA